ncbi:MAG: tripartite tricarboxylate transporter permease [Thermodesulfobacteriota bacterium]
MDILNNLSNGASVALSASNLLMCFLGVLIGTLIGVLPGLGPIATISILLPISFDMEPVTAIIMLCGVYYGAMYGGSTTSILVNIPGEVASIVTCLDGYQMARQGRAGPALGMSAFGSFIGGTVSIVGLMLVAPMLARFALRFGPPEFFALALLGLTMVTYLSAGSVVKAWIMAVAGIAISTIGMDPVGGVTRFTLGRITLMDGLGIAPVSMGIFGIAEVLTNIEEGISRQEVFQAKITGLFPTLKDWADSKWAIIRGALIGFFFGIIPGAGGGITTFMAYGVEKRLSKYPEKFGKGAIEGVASPETANNAAVSGGLVPLISLGIPPNAVMAVLVGAFIIHGIQPGPLFIGRHPDLFWGLITSMYIGNAMLLVLNLPLIGIWIRILKIPYDILSPLIFLFCFLGAYGLNNNIYEVLIMILFGIFGYFTRKFEFEGAPFLLGMVLGPIIEMHFRQSLLYGDPLIFFKRSISVVFLSISLFLLITGFFRTFKKKREQLQRALEEP